MNLKKALFTLAAAAVFVAGCQKSAPTNNMQSATPQQTPGSTPGNSASNQQNNGQPMQQPGQAPMQAQTPASEPTLPPEPPKPFVVPAGTSLSIVLGQKVDSRTDEAGQPFVGSLASAILVSEEVAIPKGATANGVITKSKKQGTFKGAADLALQLTNLQFGGKTYPISSSTWARTVKGKGKRTGVMTGGAAAGGALIGGLIGGGKGAAIGAGVGAGGGLAASGATGGENVTLQPESKITFKLTQPLTIERQ